MAPRIPARDKILDAAARLFYAHGIASTGVDTITAEAKVARMSLYNNFSSKEDLTEAYIRRRHGEWMTLYRTRVDKITGTGPMDQVNRVLAVFQAYRDHASAAYDHGFRGCGLLNAAAELPAGAPGRDAVRQHKEEVEAIISGHLHDAGLDDNGVETLSRHLAFLLEGSISRAGLEGTPDLLDQAQHLAEDLLRPVAGADG